MEQLFLIFFLTRAIYLESKGQLGILAKQSVYRTTPGRMRLRSQHSSRYQIESVTKDEIIFNTREVSTLSRNIYMPSSPQIQHIREKRRVSYQQQHTDRYHQNKKKLVTHEGHIETSKATTMQPSSRKKTVQRYMRKESKKKIEERKAAAYAQCGQSGIQNTRP